MSGLLKVDLHCHTNYSPDSLISIEHLLKRVDQLGIDRIAITDHNTIQGALKAKALNPERVIVGVEIKTNKGELLAYFVQEEVPSGLPPAETIRQLKQQGAVISVSHPFDPHRSGWGLDDLKELIPHVDAIEVFNARSLSGSYNRAAADFARAANLSPTAGSDAHILAEIGGAVVLLPYFVNAEELRLALGQASIQCRLAPFWVHFGSTFAFLKKKLQHGAS